MFGLMLMLPAFAQEGGAEHIETDRDSFTPATSTAAQGRLIVESAYSFIDNIDVLETHSFPELINRYGVNDWLELRLGANYEVGGESSSVSSGSGGLGELESAEIESEAKVTYGAKAMLTRQEGWWPESAVILQASTPTSGPENDTHLVATYVWGWEVIEGWIWDSSIRYGDASAEEDEFNNWAPSTVLKVEIAKGWTTHIEYFGIFSEGRENETSQSYLSPGIHHLITDDCEVGIRVGWRLGADAPNFFSNVGIGVRF